MNRRDLLKLFGVGATVVPIIAGESLPAVAHIIEPPKVELIERPAVSGAQAAIQAFQSIDEVDVTVFCRNRKTGDSWRYDAPAFIAQFKSNLMDVTNHESSFRRYVAVGHELTFIVNGEAKLTEWRK